MTDTTGQPTEPLSAAQALTHLMSAIEVIRKERESNAGERYYFRGVDDVMNAVGPRLRQLNLLCLPELVWQETAQVEYGGKRTLAFRTRVQVKYRLVGPDGSELIIGPVLGESIDTGDKGGAKAQSVAYREMWLRALCIPTGERDPDEDQFRIAKPEATVSDPEVVAKLTERVQKADNEGKLRTAWDAITAAYGGEQATITTGDYEALQELVKQRKSEVKGS